MMAAAVSPSVPSTGYRGSRDSGCSTSGGGGSERAICPFRTSSPSRIPPICTNASIAGISPSSSSTPCRLHSSTITPLIVPKLTRPITSPQRGHSR